MKTDEQLIKELEREIAGLLFMSESDYPFRILSCEGDIAVTEDNLRRVAEAAPDAPVTTQSMDEFFRAAMSEPDWKGAEELETAKRYQSLVRWLKENLANPGVYRVGETDIQVFILGRSQAGNWIGISTRVIET